MPASRHRHRWQGWGEASDRWGIRHNGRSTGENLGFQVGFQPVAVPALPRANRTDACPGRRIALVADALATVVAPFLRDSLAEDAVQRGASAKGEIAVWPETRREHHLRREAMVTQT